MTSILASTKVQAVLSELREIGGREDDRYRRRVAEREAQLGVTLDASDRAQFADDAPLAISAQVGEVLHALVIAARPATVIEFGASLGISTLYLASALEDLGAGHLTTTELVPGKAERTQDVLARAGLGSRVSVLIGDARRTLRDLDASIDFVFLDGANDLYIDIVEQLKPRLVTGAVIAADMSYGDTNHDAYRAHVSAKASGLLTTEISLDAGLVMSAVR